ncbi:hypothetical protein GWI33_013609 [Rhynchophorus ferrugineus]|uniref:Uncharacterized protein n=1 Tax=Rhynchophorus ferrugineus TaxID=354439 RepID=A0A834I6S3_RHYFE|nr:hypothetical protein GWI33_013609 [Rhynchophorus ferrugineus]
MLPLGIQFYLLPEKKEDGTKRTFLERLRWDFSFSTVLLLLKLIDIWIFEPKIFIVSPEENCKNKEETLVSHRLFY